MVRTLTVTTTTIDSKFSIELHLWAYDNVIVVSTMWTVFTNMAGGSNHEGGSQCLCCEGITRATPKKRKHWWVYGGFHPLWHWDPEELKYALRKLKCEFHYSVYWICSRSLSYSKIFWKLLGTLLATISCVRNQ